MPGWLLTIILSFFILAVGIWMIERIVGWGRWMRSHDLMAALRTVSGSRVYKAIINFRVLSRTTIVLWFVVLSAAVWRLNDDMIRYVIPRRLTEAQIETIAKALRRTRPHDVKFVILRGDEEASNYRGDLQRAIEKGGWPVIDVTYEAAITTAGLSISFMEPARDGGMTQEQVARERVREPRELRPHEALREALREAGAQINSFGSGSARAIDTTILTVTVGARRRDYYALPRTPARGMP